MGQFLGGGILVPLMLLLLASCAAIHLDLLPAFMTADEAHRHCANVMYKDRASRAHPPVKTALTGRLPSSSVSPKHNFTLLPLAFA